MCIRDRCPVLIAKPAVSVSTKFVYEHLKLDENTVHPDIDAQLAALSKGDLKGVAAHMGNLLETVTIPAYPVIDEIKRCMLELSLIHIYYSDHIRYRNHYKGF